jgi:SAM-dependent methyltransferase
LSILSKVRRASALVGRVVRDPRRASNLIKCYAEARNARRFCRSGFAGTSPQAKIDPALVQPDDPSNPMWAYFAANNQGPGIWKWIHYFDVYQKHLAKFIGRDVHVVEIGIFSGGSLPMWRNYLGPNSQITGVDIEETCRCYETEGIRVVIGDQADRGFWKSFRESSAPFDVVIDDGGHTPLQQRITLEETLPYLKPGGVFICEDVYRVGNTFGSYALSLAECLNGYDGAAHNSNIDIICPRSDFQSAVLSVHFYPFIVVIERSDRPQGPLACPRKGTEWQPWIR